jgi:hypothetical protein
MFTISLDPILLVMTHTTVACDLPVESEGVQESRETFHGD